ncbi:F-box protein At3g03040-like [Papaver somniferum]|uniref:F-box protein At3g03040-like n=1 Tax=Papaver somniferum TaxID=3469 RepID=UPI000E7029E9|nr:F-box protein At3g03040-like [Papaver somniferum]
MDFVDGTLHRHSSNVDKFAINWPQPLNESRVYSWVSKVVRGKLKELALHVNHWYHCSLESLVSLQLGIPGSSGFTFPKHISLPRLKRLILNAFEFSEESWNGQLFSNSPVLEHLVLHFCKFRMRNFSILIPTLKFFTIHVSRSEEIGLDCVFNIDAPRLISFSHSDFVAKEFILSSFPSVGVLQQ